MPELPEVDTIVRQLRPHLVGRTIATARLSHDDLLDDVSRTVLVRELPRRRIVDVTRRAKHALIHTDTKILAVQPGMTGALLRYDRPLTAGEAKYAVLQCRLDDGAILVYRDVRRIGTLRWLTPAAWTKYQSRLGPEPLDPAFTALAFADRVSRSRSPVKKVLMDQRVVVGVGNIYANEALFAAKIDPSKAANRVAREDLIILYQEVRRILIAAIASDGTTFRDYVTGRGEAGNFQLEIAAYGREGLPCMACGTRLAATHTIDGRSTVFCWRCQR
ncbi:MAG TPA: bifunctional DNA-formamidopyrimidine glycosylase/DNA-(apurinic or apyrimidinic site) lyase [Gemmatimonadales bacterium]